MPFTLVDSSKKAVWPLNSGAVKTSSEIVSPSRLFDVLGQLGGRDLRRVHGDGLGAPHDGDVQRGAAAERSCCRGARGRRRPSCSSWSASSCRPAAGARRRCTSGSRPGSMETMLYSFGAAFTLANISSTVPGVVDLHRAVVLLLERLHPAVLGVALEADDAQGRLGARRRSPFLGPAGPQRGREEEHQDDEQTVSYVSHGILLLCDFVPARPDPPGWHHDRSNGGICQARSRTIRLIGTSIRGRKGRRRARPRRLTPPTAG